MSRSYRHHFWFPTEGDKHNKKRFNRKLRRAHNQDFADGAAFKKKFNSWDIHSWWIHYKDEEDFVQTNLPYLKEGETEADLRRIWRTHFLSKQIGV